MLDAAFIRDNADAVKANCRNRGVSEVPVERVVAFDAKTGKAAYTKERIPQAGAFWASPWAAAGHIFCLDETGATHVLKAGAEFEVVRVNKLARDMHWSTPAAADGALFVRGLDALYCVKE